MSPYLTGSGRWILASGVVFLLIGVLTSDPLILLIGQVQIALLAVAVLLAVPGALALDRRLVELSVEPGLSPRAGTGHIVGDQVDVDLKVDNRSDIALHFFRAEAFGASALEPSDQKRPFLVPRGHGARGEFKLRGRRSGRWVLHGFDVSICDPFGLVESRDYLPAVHAFEFYPRAGRLRTRRPLRYRIPKSQQPTGAHLVHEIGTGTELRELRDYQAGDSLRDIAWKQTLKARKLVSRDYEDEIMRSACVVLDMSSSMRGGQWPGQKLEFGIQIAVDLADEILGRRDKVGLLTFDEKLYGHVESGSTTRHFQRMLHHLVGLSAVVDPDLTELDDVEIHRLAADYLLVQERLDFRKGASDEYASGVNERLLKRWLRGVSSRAEDELDSPVLRGGVISTEHSDLRRFLQLRGVEVPYRVEARLGMKERGLLETVEHLVQVAREPQELVVISDLCGIMNLDVLNRAIRLALAKRHSMRFVVPFTPSFYRDEVAPNEKYDIVKELFTNAEAEERRRVAASIQSLGVPVHFVSNRDSE